MRTVDEIREKMDEIMIEDEASVFDAFEEICEQIDEDPEVLSEEFEALSSEITSTVDDFIEKIDTFDVDIKHARQQKISWEKKITKLENDLDAYRESMAKKLKLGSRYVGTAGSIRLVKSRPEVKVLNETIIPDEFKRFITKFTIDKTSLREYLVSGNKVEGVTIRQAFHIMTKKS